MATEAVTEVASREEVADVVEPSQAELEGSGGGGEGGTTEARVEGRGRWTRRWCGRQRGGGGGCRRQQEEATEVASREGEGIGAVAG